MEIGDIVWVELPGGAGRAQAGRRPAIIAQTAVASSRLPMVLVIPLTSQLDALRFPGTVLIDPDSDNGLRRSSVALAFQLTALDQRNLSTRIGSLSPKSLDQLWQALDEIMGR